MDSRGDNLVYTTILTRRPGTTTTFFAGLPSMNFCAASDASARASIAARSAPTFTRMLPRCLPLTCNTSSSSSCTSAASTGSGQGAARMSVP
jgi:hypothetical protein